MHGRPPAGGHQPQPNTLRASSTLDPALQVGFSSVETNIIYGYWPTCGLNTTTVYSDVRALRGWIDETMAELEARVV